jgi:hypothetical protein
MPVQRVVAVIEAVDRASPTLNRISGTLKSFGAIAAAVGTAAIGTALVGGLVAATRASATYEGATVRLGVALANQGENTREIRGDLLDYAAATTKLSLATEEQIIQGLAQAKTLGASNEVAKKLITTSTDLASATGVDMETAIRQVTRTLGGYAGELQEIFPQLKELSKEELRAGAAAEALAGVLAGAGAAGARTMEGAVNNLQSGLKQLGTTIGSGVRDAITLFLTDVVNPTIGQLTELENSFEAVRIGTLRTAAAIADLGAIMTDVLSSRIGQLLLQRNSSSRSTWSSSTSRCSARRQTTRSVIDGARMPRTCAKRQRRGVTLRPVSRTCFKGRYRTARSSTTC